jgi:hypothetical protein
MSAGTTLFPSPASASLMASVNLPADGIRDATVS